MIRKVGVTVAMVLGLGLLAPVAAQAAATTPSVSDCVLHSIAATEVGPKLEVATTLTNNCGRQLAGTVGYLVSGPCGHIRTFPVVLYAGAEDVVTFFRSPCAGHYTLTQRVTADGSRVGSDTIEFDVGA
jgi:hypothetical protein